MKTILTIGQTCCYLAIYFIFNAMGYDFYCWQPWAIWGLFTLVDFFYLLKVGYFTSNKN